MKKSDDDEDCDQQAVSVDMVKKTIEIRNVDWKVWLIVVAGVTLACSEWVL